MRVFPLESPDDFRRWTVESWDANAEFWLSEREVDKGLRSLLTQMVLAGVSEATQAERSRQATVLDIGFGSAWLRSALHERPLQLNYVGVDRSSRFVRAAESRFAGQSNTRFLEVDFEEPLGENLSAIADVAVACMSLCEMANLRIACKNTFRALREGGVALVAMLDPIQQIVRSTESLERQRDALGVYRGTSGRCVISKRISQGGAQSISDYFTILYPLQDVVSEAIESGFSLVDIRTAGLEQGRTWIDPIFHLLKFSKQSGRPL